MGRWDALKPDTPTEGSADLAIRRHDTITNDRSAVIRQTRNRQTETSNRWRSQAGMRGGSRQIRLWESALKEQLELHHIDAPGFQMERVESTLREIAQSSKESRAGLTLVAVVRLLEIQDERIQNLALGVINDRANDDLPTGEAVECVEKLASLAMMRPKSSDAVVQCLGRLVAGQANHLPAEETSERVVRSILLPALGATSNDEMSTVSIFQSVEKLLQHANFSSAILAPLVQDVTDEGKEDTAPNLIRRNLFQVLQEKLFSETLSMNSRAMACAVLTTVVEKLHKMNSKKATSDVNELDQAQLERFLSDYLGLSSSLYEPSCRLLKALLQVYPLTKLGTRLLFSGGAINMGQTTHKSIVCSYCGCRPAQVNPFLGSVHGSLGTSSSELGMDCVAELLIELPLELWLYQPSSGLGPVSGFHRKVVDSLVNVLAITRCAVLRECAGSDAMGNLCKKAFQQIPWYNDQVVEAGEDLWESLINRLDDGDTAHRKNISDILIHGMGGKVTPQGNLTVMIPPAHRWLSHQAKALPFLRGLLGGIQSDKSRLKRLIFCAIVRSHPESVIPCWESFIDVIEQARSDDPNHQEICVDLFEALLLGRKDFPSDNMVGISSTISKLFFDLAIRLREIGNVNILCGLLRCYTALTTADWSLLERDPTLLAEHVRCILVYCSDISANVRRASCKAIGEFCAMYLDHSRLSEEREASWLTTLVNSICATMGERLKVERDASAQAMVIYALGNLALAVIENGGYWIIDDGWSVSVATDILIVMDTSNDKVVGNAIRSIGHFGSILMFFGKSQIVVNILNALSFRIARTVAVAYHEDRAAMTWKERSSAKKHGWGACHSLGRIFHAVTDDDPAMNDALRRGVEQLSQCILRANALSEKVVLASMAALRELKPTCLDHIVGKSGMLGDALAGVCILVFREHSNPKFVQQGDLLLSYLLPGASITDAAAVLRNEEVSRPILDSLYLWMVDHEMEGRAFDIFALALQRPGLSARNDVSLEQRFASRALMQYKKLVHVVSLERDDDEDRGDDEL